MCYEALVHTYHHLKGLPVRSYTDAILFRYLPVTIHGNGKHIRTYAFLDDGSNSTLLESNIASALGFKGPTDGFSLSWTGNISREEKESQRISVIISGDDKKLELHNVRTVQQLQLPAQTMRYEALVHTYHNLKGLPVRSYTDAIPGIIIGIEHIRLLTALETREGRDNEPVATKTCLGWCILGKNSDSGATTEQLNLHLASELKVCGTHQWVTEERNVTVKPEPEGDKRTIYSGNGTQFMGDSNPGGYRRALVGGSKTVMSAIVDHLHHPNDDVLETVVLEAEAIGNSRPLTYIPLKSMEQNLRTLNDSDTKGQRCRHGWKEGPCVTDCVCQCLADQSGVW
ncbi:uncharacterized protein LOC129761755 isoform X3 [Toxorhynchites rutilus septentrionalis]|uniref:uncharacterized protein LOC129761755 isoform X3 n=1 Tax=Toxorhynchites rutilus septentrionalis TaxID=329112 RepID=UPI0024788CF9|nr:uncharacterized protein LOC129761755 isoform X3 [Toxorhynchites rutilus septentrionalis]